MCKAKVNNNNFSQRPVLLLIKIIDKKIFYFLNFFEAFLNFKDYEQSQVSCHNEIGVDINN